MGEPFRAAPGEPYPVVRWFARADRNGDGRIDRAEFLADAKAFFAILDRNHDSVIDGFELQAYEQDVAPEILGAYHGGPSGEPEAEADGEGRHRRMHRGGQDDGASPDADRGADSGVVLGGAAAYDFFSDPEPVASTDRTLSGRIALADFLAAASARFERLDVKGVGYVTLADLPKTAAQRGPGRPDAGRRESR